MIDLDGATHIPASETPERKFIVYRKGNGGMTVDAEQCLVTPAGALVFQTKGALVSAFSPTGWSFVEEAEADD